MVGEKSIGGFLRIFRNKTGKLFIKIGKIIIVMKVCPWTGKKIIDCDECALWSVEWSTNYEFKCPLLSEYIIRMREAGIDKFDFSNLEKFLGDCFSKLSDTD